MYAIEFGPEPIHWTEVVHPKRFKQVYLKILALQPNPHPPDSVMLDGETYFVRVGSYKIAYTVDDARQRAQVYAVKEGVME